LKKEATRGGLKGGLRNSKATSGKPKLWKNGTLKKKGELAQL